MKLDFIFIDLSDVPQLRRGTLATWCCVVSGKKNKTVDGCISQLGQSKTAIQFSRPDSSLSSHVLKQITISSTEKTNGCAEYLSGHLSTPGRHGRCADPVPQLYLFQSFMARTKRMQGSNDQGGYWTKFVSA